MGLPLDDVSTGYSSAYGTRLLRTAYAGALVRLKDSITTTETDFFQGATAGSLNTVSGGGGTDALTLYAASNGTLAKWYDQSGQGKHMAQSTVSSQPTVVSSGRYYATQNGFPAVMFFGNNFLTCVTTYAAPVNFTLYSVSQGTSVGSYAGMFHPDDMSTGWGVMQVGSSGGQLGVVRANNGKVKTTGWGINTTYLMDFSYDGTTDSIFRNGVSDSTTWTDSGFSNVGGAFSGYTGNTANDWIGWIAELIVYNSGHSTGNKGIIRTDLNNFWNVYSTSIAFAKRAPYHTGLASEKGIASVKW